MAMFELPPIPEPRVSPQLLVGAASPLWTYFGAAASAGVAYWWMARWAQPANLEALFGGRALMPDIVADTVAADLEPVGGGSAPISPVVEATAAPSLEAEALVQPAIDAPPEDAPSADIAAPTPLDADAVGEASPKARPRKTSTDPEA